MEKLTRFNEKVNVRLFFDEKKQIDNIVAQAKNKDGFKKYENSSHFIRSAIINQIKVEKNV